VNGIAKFNNVIFDTAGTYTLSATDSSDTVSSAVSDSITIDTQGQQHGHGRHHDDGFRDWF